MSLTKLQIANNALDLVGQGTHIESLDETSKEADLISRLFDETVKRMLMKFDYNFARKDEVITENNLLDVVSLHWDYTYSLPSDVLRVLYLTDINDTSDCERIRRDNLNRFSFRQISSQTCLVTDMPYPFVIHYQALITDTALFSISFTEALEFMLASRLAVALIHGTNGLNMSQGLLQQGMVLSAQASDIDAQQGADSIQQKEKPLFISARY